MADKKITQLNNITGANLANADEFVVVDVSADETMSVTRQQLFSSVPDITVTGNVGIGGSVAIGNDLNITGPSPKIRLTDDETALEYTEIYNSSGNLIIQSRNGTEDGIILFRGFGGGTATEFGRFDDTGYFGIGTTSPNTPLEILTSTANSAYIRVGSSKNSSSWTIGEDIAGLEFYGGDSSGAGAGVKGSIRYKALSSSASPTAMTFHVADSAGDGANDVERMRLDYNGNLNLGGLLTDTFPSNNTSGSGITLRSDGRLVNVCDGLSGLNIGRHTTEGNVAQFYYNGTIEGSISITETSTAYNTTSDYRLKTDAQPMVGASDLVQALNPVNFEWRSNGTRVNGFLAHEVQAVVPEAVTGTQDAMQDEEYEVSPAVEATYDDEGTQLTPTTIAVMGTRSVPEYQSIDQSKLVPLLTAALQEALTKIEAMETRLAALEE